MRKRLRPLKAVAPVRIRSGLPFGTSTPRPLTSRNKGQRPWCVSDGVRPGPAVSGYLCPTRVHVAVGVGVLERGLDALADQGAAAVVTLAWILSSTSTECPASAAAGNVCP